MRSRFDCELELLNNELILMGGLIEKSIQSAVEALVSKDILEAQNVIKQDKEVDEKEKTIEQLCLKLLLQQQPVASDLRFISSALKMITDMERIGDQAADIAELSIYLSQGANFVEFQHIEKMAKETIDMVTSSIDAFVHRDFTLAKAVIMKDDIVDSLFIQMKQEVIKLIQKNSEFSEQATDLLMVAKYFERIGDHATNIAEWVIFAITGVHVNHKDIEK